MAEAYIVDAVRTPRGIGKQGKGALSHLHPQDLGATVLRALRDRNDLDTAKVDDIVWSCSQQRGKQGGDLGRLSALWAGYDVKASGTTIDRFCGGGISSVAFAAGQIMAGFEDVVIAGGTEMMSYHAELDALESQTELGTLGRARGNYELYQEHPISAVGTAADAIAAMEGISRADLEALGVDSQRKARRRSTRDGSPRALSRSITATAAWRWTMTNIPAPIPPPKGLPRSSPRSWRWKMSPPHPTGPPCAA